MVRRQVWKEWWLLVQNVPEGRGYGCHQAGGHPQDSGPSRAAPSHRIGKHCTVHITHKTYKFYVHTVIRLHALISFFDFCRKLKGRPSATRITGLTLRTSTATSCSLQIIWSPFLKTLVSHPLSMRPLFASISL